jgi:CBS domain-containing protein
VLRSIIWGLSGSLTRATNIAATTGQVFGWIFIAYGVYQLIFGNFLSGIWIAFIGWFLINAAGASRRQVTMSEHLRGVKISDVMDSGLECVSPQTPVDVVVRGLFFQRGRRAVPVCQDDRLVGIVTITDIKELPMQRWAETPVEAIMTSRPLHTVEQDDDLNVALRLIAEHGINQVPVLKGGRLVGLLSRADIIRYLQLS